MAKSTRPIVFMSHIAEESEITSIFKNELEAKFLGMIDIFVSSDSRSLSLGKNWLDEITNGLRSCVAMLVFCSPYSIERPWLNFECGAGWARGIEIAPLCHSGIRPVDLPLPLSLLQGMDAADPQKIQQIFELVAGKLQSQVPQIDAPALAANVRAFEQRYTEEAQTLRHLREIKVISAEFFELLTKIQEDTVTPIQRVPEQLVVAITKQLNSLQIGGYLSYRYGVMGIAFGGQGGGNFGELTLNLTRRLTRAIKSIG